MNDMLGSGIQMALDNYFESKCEYYQEVGFSLHTYAML